MNSNFKCVNCSDWGIFLLRFVLGAIFIAHGFGKIQGIGGTITFFASLGLGAFFAYLVAWIEFLTGIAMLFGIFTRIAGYLIAAIMFVAIITVKIKRGFMGGYELDLLILVSALAISWSNTKAFSLASFIEKKCNCGGKCFICKESTLFKFEKSTEISNDSDLNK